MSQLQQHLPAEVIAAASTSEVLEAAQVLLRAAYDKTRDQTGNNVRGTEHDSIPERARGEGAGAKLSDDELLDQFCTC